MNQFLDFSGAVIYLGLRLILFPLFMAFRFFIWTWVAIKQMKTYQKQLIKWRSGNKETAYQLPQLIDGAVARLKSLY